MLRPPSEIREVREITDDRRDAFKFFMQGAAYCCVKTRMGEPFAVRDLMGVEKFYWQGTPLIVLYEKHVALGKDNDSAIEGAGQDLGWLVKAALHEDKRTLELAKAGLVNTYRWVVNEP